VKGVTGTVSSKQIAVGNAEMFRTSSIDPAPLLSHAYALRKEGQTVMLFAVDNGGRVLQIDCNWDNPLALSRGCATP
jgi:cation transport ATPase